MKAIEKKKLRAIRGAILKANKLAKKGTDNRRELYSQDDREYIQAVKRNNQVFRKAAFMVPALSDINMWRLFNLLQKDRSPCPNWALWWWARTYDHKLIVAKFVTPVDAAELEAYRRARDARQWAEYYESLRPETSNGGYKVIGELSPEAEAERQLAIKEEA